ncbi:CHAT domain-containing protein [Isoptericola haloaureus]|uniref:CHAT domain-containing protein n=1 Tax=Isoptericola haloaureus TaxID=1542902 RepID=A0ABU7Z983_9MICO
MSPLDPALHGAWVVDLRVRALVGEASCTYGLSGDLDGARRLVAEALVVAEAGGHHELSAVAHGQDGLLLLRSGDARGAAAAFDRALSAADPENHRDLAVLHINRGAAAGELRDLDADLRHHQIALHHARLDGNDRYAAFALFNIGFAYYLRGDFHRALRNMEESSALQPEGPDGWSEVGRAQVLLDAGLVTEAEKVLADSADMLSAEDLTGEMADALLARARCAILLRRPEEALRWAGRSRRAFARVGNDSWALAARITALEARLALDRERGTARRTTLRRRRDDALTLASEGGDESAAPSREAAVAARLLAAEWSLLAGDHDRAAEIVGEVPRLGSSPLPLRIHHESVRAQVAFAGGDRRRGLLAVRRGHRVLADHRARLGSVDTVTAAAAHGTRIARVDVEAALATRRPWAVFDALERGRAAYAGAARVRPPDDEQLAELLTMARAAAEDARELATSTDPGDRARAAKRSADAHRLQQRARRRSWQLAGTGDRTIPEPTTARDLIRDLRAACSDAVVVSYLLTERVTAVRLDATGARLVELGSSAEAAELARRVRQDVDVLANGLIPAPMREVAATSARRSLERLDDLLLGPLEVHGPLHVAARDGLLAVPWASLPSRAGIATSVDSWVARYEPVDGGDRARAARALVVAGPGLAAADDEARLVAEEWVAADPRTGERATCAAVRESLADVQVVHLAAHGVHEPDNPLFSFVRLADGPLYAHELDGVNLRGTVVVLSACEVGRASVRLGGEPLGLTSVLLRLGARAVVAAVAPLRDEVAARVMPRLHSALRDGREPATALALAVAPEPEPVPLVCFGPLAVERDVQETTATV